MNIIVGLPPNFEAIDAVFHLRRLNLSKLAICYGDSIYCPTRWDFGAEIMAHEQVHSGQQRAMGGPEVWWDRYLIDPQFRLEQEIEASRAEWRRFVEAGHNRNQRRAKIAHMAGALASKLYGNMVTAAAAKREILRGMQE